MSIYEIISGVVLLLVALAIIVLTLAQQSKGRGLSGAIVGDAGQMEAGRSRGNDAKMARFTVVAGIIFVVVTILVSVLSARLG